MTPRFRCLSAIAWNGIAVSLGRGSLSDCCD